MRPFPTLTVIAIWAALSNLLLAQTPATSPTSQPIKVPPQYRLIDLGESIAATNYYVAVRVNDAGAVLWQGQNIHPEPIKYFVWIPDGPGKGRVHELPNIRNARGFNRHTQVVGTNADGPVLWQPPKPGEAQGRLIPLPWAAEAKPKDYVLTDLGDDGLIVGGSGDNLLVGWVDSTGKVLAPLTVQPGKQFFIPGLPLTNNGVVAALNGRGVLHVGRLNPPETQLTMQSAKHIEVKADVNMTNIWPMKVLGDGSIVGYTPFLALLSTPVNKDPLVRRISVLQQWPGVNGSAKVLGANNHGVLVGAHRNLDMRAVRWDDVNARPVDLNDLVDRTGLGEFVLSEACDINDSGMIAGIASWKTKLPLKPRTFLLIPLAQR